MIERVLGGLIKKETEILVGINKRKMDKDNTEKENLFESVDKKTSVGEKLNKKELSFVHHLNDRDNSFILLRSDRERREKIDDLSLKPSALSSLDKLDVDDQEKAMSNLVRICLNKYHGLIGDKNSFLKDDNFSKVYEVAEELDIKNPFENIDQQIKHHDDTWEALFLFKERKG